MLKKTEQKNTNSTNSTNKQTHTTIHRYQHHHHHCMARYRSVQKVLFFPPWDTASAVGAPQPKPKERFHELWKCSSDVRVLPTEWASTTAAACESVDAMIIEASPHAEGGGAARGGGTVHGVNGVPSNTESSIGGPSSAWSKIECLLTVNATLSFQVRPVP